MVFAFYSKASVVCTRYCSLVVIHGALRFTLYTTLFRALG